MSLESFCLKVIFKKRFFFTVVINENIYTLICIKLVCFFQFFAGLLAQGGTSRDQKLTIRLLAGSWCVACFVLVTAYSSVLISFVTSPYYKPLIRSVYDIPKNPNIKITVNRGWSPDLLFTVSAYYKAAYNKYDVL
jgi:hypothetical protein